MVYTTQASIEGHASDCMKLTLKGLDRVSQYWTKAPWDDGNSACGSAIDRCLLFYAPSEGNGDFRDKTESWALTTDLVKTDTPSLGKSPVCPVGLYAVDHLKKVVHSEAFWQQIGQHKSVSDLGRSFCGKGFTVVIGLHSISYFCH